MPGDWFSRFLFKGENQFTRNFAREGILSEDNVTLLGFQVHLTSQYQSGIWRSCRNEESRGCVDSTHITACTK